MSRRNHTPKRSAGSVGRSQRMSVSKRSRHVASMQALKREAQNGMPTDTPQE